MPRSVRSVPAEAVGPLSLLAGFLGGPVAWVLHLTVSYFLVALACTTGWESGRTAIFLATVAFLGLAVGAGVLAHRNWRRLQATPSPGELFDAPRIRGFMMLGGMLLAALFGLIILLAGLPPLFVPLCG